MLIDPDVPRETPSAQRAKPLKPSDLARIDLISAYVAGLGLTSVHLLSATAEPDLVYLEVSPGLQPTGPRADGLTVVDGFMFESEAHAEIVATAVSAPLRGLDLARRTVIETSATAGAPWRAMPEVIAGAGADIVEIERHLDALKNAGGLSWLNKQYKTYRKLCVATLTPAIQYQAYLHTLKLKMVELAARNIAAGRDKFAGLDAIRIGKPNADAHADRWPTSGRTHVLPGWSPRAPAHRRDW